MDNNLLGKEEPYNFKADLAKALNKEGLNIDMIDVIIDNDGDWAAKAASSEFADLLPAGKSNINTISGTDTNINIRLGSGQLINTEDGHEVIGDLDLYSCIEGPTRKSFNSQGKLIEGRVGDYVSGGPKDKNKRGAKATANFLLKLINDNYLNQDPEQKLNEAFKLLGIESTKDIFAAKHSKLRSLEMGKVRNEDITEYANQGDLLSTKILEHTMRRLAQRVKLKVDELEGQKKADFRLATVTGTFGNVMPDSAKNEFEKVLNKDRDEEKKINVRFFQPAVDGAYRIAADKLKSQYRQYKAAS